MIILDVCVNYIPHEQGGLIRALDDRALTIHTRAMERAGVEANLYEAFGPLIDVGEGSRMGFLDRRITQTAMVGLSNDLGLELDMKGRNDLRDWDRIRDFVHRFAESLRN